MIGPAIKGRQGPDRARETRNDKQKSPPPRYLTTLAALVALTLTLPMAAQAQEQGLHVCNGADITASYSNHLTIAHGDTKTYPSWFTRATPATASNSVTVTVSGLNLARVNGQYVERDGTSVNTRGTATSATYLLGLFKQDGSLSHGFYSVLAFNTAGTVPTQTVTFHSLEPDTVYIVAPVVKDLEGETDTERTGRDLARNCFRTAPAPS